MGRIMPSFLSLLFLLFLCSSVSYGEKVTVSVKGLASIGTTDDNFICATIDWWPPGKCNYDQCPWKMTSVLNLDLDNPVLPKALKAFDPLRIRIGGSLQDQVVYGVGNAIKTCPHFKNRTSGLFGFSKGCLPMDRWDKVHDFFNQSGVKLTFGLNALFGRKQLTKDGAWGGPWNSANARDFMKHIVSKGQQIDSFELGNELSGSGVSAKVDAQQYGKDMIMLKRVVTDTFRNYQNSPMVLAPGGFFDQQWFQDMLQVSGPNVIDGVTHHIYNLGPGDDPNLIHKIQDPDYLDNVVQTFTEVKSTVTKFGPWSSAWVGESGGAYNSGGRTVSHSFVDSFWYLDQLGMASEFDHKVYCRQSLIGGNYGLLNTTTMVPNPDYYSALLWHRLMGKSVLSTNHGGSADLRVYAHCSKKETGITALLINLSNSTSFDVSIVEDSNLYPPMKREKVVQEGSAQREEYHLTPKNGDIQSTTMLLNGVPLVLTEKGDIPSLNPNPVDSLSPIKMSPLSIAFVTIKDFKAPACSS